MAKKRDKIRYCLEKTKLIYTIYRQHIINKISSGGGIGRHAALRSLWENYPVGVRVPSWANQKEINKRVIFTILYY